VHHGSFELANANNRKRPEGKALTAADVRNYKTMRHNGAGTPKTRPASLLLRLGL